MTHLTPNTLLNPLNLQQQKEEISYFMLWIFFLEFHIFPGCLQYNMIFWLPIINIICKFWKKVFAPKTTSPNILINCCLHVTNYFSTINIETCHFRFGCNLQFLLFLLKGKTFYIEFDTIFIIPLYYTVS